MKAISLWQPWASLIAVGAKTVETRSWPTQYRGTVAIHAAKKWNADLAVISAGSAFRRYLDREGKLVWNAKVCPLPTGCIVAVADLLDVRRTADLVEYLGPGDERHFGDYSPGRFGWLLGNVRPLRVTVPCRGMQGLFDLPDVVREAVQRRAA